MATGAPDYYKSILLYGLYQDQIIPLACDNQGRLLFITEEVSPFDKTGTILQRDDFDNGLIHCETGGDGTGNAVEVSTTEAFIGAQSCQLIGGSDGNRSAYVKYHYVPADFNKLGISVNTRFGLYLEYFEINAAWHVPGYKYQAKIRHEVGLNYWELYDGATDTWVEFLTGVQYYLGAHRFYQFKLVVDIEAEKYHTFKHIEGIEDISAYSLDKATSGWVLLSTAEFKAISLAGKNGYLFVDNVILTQDES